MKERYRILIVGDCESFYKEMFDSLSRYNIAISYIPDVSKSLKEIEVFKPSVIIKYMSESSFEESDRAISSYKACDVSKDIPIMIVSDSSEYSLKAHFFEMGVDDYMVSPFVMQEVMSRVKRLSQNHFSRLELREAYLKLQKISKTDSLTGLANRMYLDDFLEQEWNRSSRDNTDIGIIMCDIDCFKEFNDTYGHVAGDFCLEVIASALKSAVGRKTDLVGRYGGEEFMIILHSPGSEDSVRSIVDKILKEVETASVPHSSSTVEGSEVVTLSVGGFYVSNSREIASTESVVKADECLYFVKKNGKNGSLIKSQVWFFRILV